METHTPKSLPPPPEGFRIVTDVNGDGSLKITANPRSSDVSRLIAGTEGYHWSCDTPYHGADYGPWAVRIGSEIDRLNTFEPSIPPGLPPLPPLPEGYVEWRYMGREYATRNHVPTAIYYDDAEPFELFKVGLVAGGVRGSSYFFEAIPATPSDVFGPDEDGGGSADVIDRPKDLRDEFAIEAMKSFLRSGGVHVADEGEAREDAMIYAQASYLYADAMLIFRNRKSALADALIAADKRKEDGV